VASTFPTSTSALDGYLANISPCCPMMPWPASAGYSGSRNSLANSCQPCPHWRSN
jgi:hypothetical protein